MSCTAWPTLSEACLGTPEGPIYELPPPIARLISLEVPTAMAVPPSMPGLPAAAAAEAIPELPCTAAADEPVTTFRLAPWRCLY